jgi:rod shape-determining protein MreB and related proteins
LLTKRLALDIGSSRSRLFLEGKGLLADIPSVVALDEETNRILAVGEPAKKLLGRNSENIKIIFPVENGAVVDFKGTEAIISHLFHLTLGRFLFFRPEVLLSCPISTTQVERRTLIDATLSAGAKSAHLVEQPLCAALGAHIPISDSTGSMVINLGAGTIECVIISNGGIISKSFVKFGFSKIDKIISSYILKKRNLTIGLGTTELIKHQLSCAMPEGTNVQTFLEVNGQDIATNMPKSIKVTEEEIVPCVSKISQEIISCTRKVFENTPPELSADIIDKGIMLTGGGAKLKMLNKLIMQSCGLACHVAEHPDKCTVLGLGEILSNPDIFKL